MNMEYANASKDIMLLVDTAKNAILYANLVKLMIQIVFRAIIMGQDIKEL